jgi:hypothetical protein
MIDSAQIYKPGKKNVDTPAIDALIEGGFGGPSRVFGVIAEAHIAACHIWG